MARWIRNPAIWEIYLLESLKVGGLAGPKSVNLRNLEFEDFDSAKLGRLFGFGFLQFAALRNLDCEDFGDWRDGAIDSRHSAISTDWRIGGFENNQSDSTECIF